MIERQPKPKPMASHRSFGRRVNPQHSAPVARPPVVVSRPKSKPDLAAIADEPASRPAGGQPPFADDDELQAWKKARRFTIPWRQISLMATLCFGVASFVLPAATNDAVQWLLLALMAASVYAGFAKRRRNARN